MGTNRTEQMGANFSPLREIFINVIVFVYEYTYIVHKHTEVSCVIFMCYFSNLKTFVTHEDNLSRQYRGAGDKINPLSVGLGTR